MTKVYHLDASKAIHGQPASVNSKLIVDVEKLNKKLFLTNKRVNAHGISIYQMDKRVDELKARLHFITLFCTVGYAILLAILAFIIFKVM